MQRHEREYCRTFISHPLLRHDLPQLFLTDHRPGNQNIIKRDVFYAKNTKKMAFRILERTTTLMCFFIDEIEIHQCFCPFHHFNYIFLMFQLPGWETDLTHCLDAIGWKASHDYRGENGFSFRPYVRMRSTEQRSWFARGDRGKHHEESLKKRLSQEQNRSMGLSDKITFCRDMKMRMMKVTFISMKSDVFRMNNPR